MNNIDLINKHLNNIKNEHISNCPTEEELKFYINNPNNIQLKYIEEHIIMCDKCLDKTLLIRENIKNQSLFSSYVKNKKHLFGLVASLLLVFIFVSNINTENEGFVFFEDDNYIAYVIEEELKNVIINEDIDSLNYLNSEEDYSYFDIV